MALALYRKYRPATFAEVVGQEHVTEPLRTALASGRINHAYLFSGPRGCGKTSSARILARSLNCVNGPTPDPCGVCDSCIALAPEGPGSLDVVELDAASHGGVDDTRELRDRAFYVPAESRYRVFIIDEAHMVTSQGFNALLKIVEEPPEHLVFVFATTEPDKVLATIRSRTHHYPFRLIPPPTLRALLERLCTEEGVAVEPAVFPLVVKAGAGSARDSLSVMDQLLAGAGSGGVTYANAVALLGVTDAALLDEMVDALAASDGAGVFGAVERVADAGHDPRRFGADLLQRLRDLVILQAVPDAADKGIIDVPEDQMAAMVGQAARLPSGTVTRFAEILHSGLADMRGTTSPRLVLELLCARMLLPGVSDGDAAVLQRLERLERRLDIAGGGVVGPSGDGGARESGARESSARGGSAGGGTSRDAARGSAPSEPAPRDPAGHERARTVPVRPAPAPATQTGRPEPAAEAIPASESAAGTGPVAPAAEQPAWQDDPLGLPPPPVLSSDQPAGPTAEPAQAPVREAVGEPSPEPAPEHGDVAAAASVAAPADPAGGAGDSGVSPAGDSGAGPAGGSGVSAADVRRVWSEILAVVKQQRRTTQVLLESATVASVDGGSVGGTLHLTMPTAALARRVVEPGNTDVLRSALRDVLGVDWRVRCDEGGGAAARSEGGGRLSASLREPAGDDVAAAAGVAASRTTRSGEAAAAAGAGDGPRGGAVRGAQQRGQDDGEAGPPAWRGNAEPAAPVRGSESHQEAAHGGPGYDGGASDDDLPDFDEDERVTADPYDSRDPDQAAVELLTSKLGARPLEEQ